MRREINKFIINSNPQSSQNKIVGFYVSHTFRLTSCLAGLIHRSLKLQRTKQENQIT